MPIIPINSKISIRLFSRVETVNDCFRIFDIGIESVDEKSDTPRVDSIVLPGYASQFHRTRPVSEIKADADKASASDGSLSEDKSEVTPPSEKTEDDTPVTPVTPVPPTEETSVDTKVEPEAQTRVETEEERVQRQLDELSEDGEGNTYS